MFGQEFRDDIGNLTAVPASDLELQLKDLGSKTVVGNSKSLSIPSFLLYEFLVHVESVDKLTKGRKMEMDQLELWMRKRKGQRTPPEELNSDDEQRHLDSC